MYWTQNVLLALYAELLNYRSRYCATTWLVNPVLFERIPGHEAVVGWKNRERVSRKIFNFPVRLDGAIGFTDLISYSPRPVERVRHFINSRIRPCSRVRTRADINICVWRKSRWDSRTATVNSITKYWNQFIRYVIINGELEEKDD